MNIRDAILQAADHIGLHPDQFRFGSVDVPDAPGCGTPGCALGWISHFLGFTDAQLFCELKGFDSALDINASLFYERMDAINGQWRCKPTACSSSLLAYADKYHPAGGVEEVRGIPDTVRQIFDMTPEQIGAALAAA